MENKTPVHIDNWGRIAADYMPLVKNCCTKDMNSTRDISCPMGEFENKEGSQFFTLICSGKVFLIISKDPSHFSPSIIRELKPFKHISSVSELSFDFDKLVFEFATIIGDCLLCLMDNQQRWYFGEIVINMPGHRCSVILSDSYTDLGIPLQGLGNMLVVAGEDSILGYTAQKSKSTVWSSLKNMIFQSAPLPPTLDVLPHKIRDLDKDKETEKRHASIKSFQPSGDILLFSQTVDSKDKLDSEHAIECAILRPLWYTQSVSTDPDSFHYFIENKCNHSPLL